MLRMNVEIIALWELPRDNEVQALIALLQYRWTRCSLVQLHYVVKLSTKIPHVWIFKMLKLQSDFLK